MSTTRGMSTMSAPAISSKFIYGLILIVVILLIGVLLNLAYFQTEAGYTYHYQNMLSSKIEIYTEPGVHFRMPFFSLATPYK